MPSIEKFSRFQTAVLWRFSEEHDSYGQRKVLEPVEVSVRWQNVYAEMLDEEGETIPTDAWVILSEEVENGSIMYLGTLESLYGTGTDYDSTLPDPTNLMEVVISGKTPDLKNKDTRYWVKLKKYKSSLPGITT